MRISSLLASVLSLALATLAVAEEASDVVDLTPANFKSVVDPEKLILVEFFAPWCVLFYFLFLCGRTRLIFRHLLKVRALQGACSSLRGSGYFAQRKRHQDRQGELCR